jgi:hypothetical protein
MHASPRPDWLSTSLPAYAILLLLLVALLIGVGSELWPGAALIIGPQPEACTDLRRSDDRLVCYDHEYHRSPAEPARGALAPLGREVMDPHD